MNTRCVMSPLRDIDQADDKERQPDDERIGGTFRNLEHHLHLEGWIRRTATTRPLKTGLPTWSSIFRECSACEKSQSANVRRSRTSLGSSTASRRTLEISGH